MNKDRTVQEILLPISLMIVLLLTLALPSAAQSAPPHLVRDTVYPQSGRIYYGRIIKYRPEKAIKLREPRGWTTTFRPAEVDSIGWSVSSRIRFAARGILLDSVPVVDVVYLKDGSLLRGHIQEYRQGESLKIKMKAGELVVQESEIERIVQEPEDPQFMAALKRLQRKKERVYAFTEHGFYSTLVLALLPGGGEYRSQMGMSLQASFGHQFSRQLGIGLGASVDGYANEVGGNAFLPLFAEVRGYLWKKMRTPYWVVAGGYGFPLRTEVENQNIRRFEGGYMLHPAVGYRLGAGKSVNIALDVGYKFQRALTEREFFFSGDIVTREVLYRRLSLRVSAIF